MYPHFRYEADFREDKLSKRFTNFKLPNSSTTGEGIKMDLP